MAEIELDPEALETALEAYWPGGDEDKWPDDFTNHEVIREHFRTAIRAYLAATHHVSDEAVKRAATEFLSHKGVMPYRITRRGAERWEDDVPAMRAALSAALAHTGKPTVKALEWTGNFDNTAYAESVFGEYSGWIIGGSAYMRPPGGCGGTIVGTTADDIKRAAVENIEARILPALQTGGET